MNDRKAKIWWFTHKQLLSLVKEKGSLPIFPAGTETTGATYCPNRQSFGLILINNQWPIIHPSEPLPSYITPDNATCDNEQKNKSRSKKKLENTVTSILDGFTGSHKSGKENND